MKNKTLNILISEHDSDDQFIFRKAFEELDPTIVVSFVFNYAQLKQFCLSCKVLPQLILADVMSPFFELTSVEELVASDKVKDIPVYLFVEAHTGIKEEDAIKAGAAKIFHKPANIELLKGILQQVLSEVTIFEAIKKTI